MRILFLLIAFATYAQHVRVVDQNVIVRWTNTPPHIMVQWSPDLTYWVDYLEVQNHARTNWNTFEFVASLQQAGFWRYQQKQ